MPFTFSSLSLVLVSVLHVLAESHTVRFQNNCGTGTPKLIQGGNALSTGEDYTSNGPLNSAIAYLDRNDECLLNGENCAIVEMNLNNPACAGCGSSVDISLIPSHAFNVATAFAFFGGDGDVCDGLGAVCADANCDTAFFAPDDNQVQRACQADNVNLLITFCGGLATQFTEAVVGSLDGESSSSGSSSSSKVASSTSSTKAASTSSSKATSTSSSKVATSTASSASSTSKAAASPASSSSSASADASLTAVVNVGVSSSADPSVVSTSTSSSSAAKASPTCSRKSSRRARRSSTLSRHARSQARARAFAGMDDSKL